MTFGGGYTQILGTRTSLVNGVICGNLWYYKLWHPQWVSFMVIGANSSGCNIGFWMIWAKSRWNIWAGRDRSDTPALTTLSKTQLTDCSSANESYTRSCLLVDYFFHYNTAVVCNMFYGCALRLAASTDHRVWYQLSRLSSYYVNLFDKNSPKLNTSMQYYIIKNLWVKQNFVFFPRKS